MSFPASTSLVIASSSISLSPVSCSPSFSRWSRSSSWSDLQLLGTFHGLILVYTAYSLPFSIFFLTGFFRTLPCEVAEAAIIDGASHYRVFFNIMLPLAQPGLVAVGIFNVLGQWNQFILPLVLNPARTTMCSLRVWPSSPSSRATRTTTAPSSQR